MLSTDGVHEHMPPGAIVRAIATRMPPDLDAAALSIVQQALENSSPDNCTGTDRRHRPRGPGRRQRDAAPARPTAPATGAVGASSSRGYEIVRELHTSHRSHVYLATGFRRAPDARW